MRAAATRFFVRLPAAALLLVGGLVHLEVWEGGYRGIPYIGPLFFLNVVASATLAAALVVRGDRWVTLPGVAVAGSSLVALALSRTVGVFGFMESGLSPDALWTVAAEVGAIVAIGLIALTRRQAKQLVAVAQAGGPDRLAAVASLS